MGDVLGVVSAIVQGLKGCQTMTPHRVDIDSKQAVQVAVAWVASQAPALCRWLGADAVARRRKALQRAGEGVAVYFR